MYCVLSAPVFSTCLDILFISIKPHLVAYSSKGAAEIMSIVTMIRGQDTNEKRHKRYPDTCDTAYQVERLEMHTDSSCYHSALEELVR